tara:strand:- start:2999 stop:3298 length:300 start_codon:yes stop_codon:yes gene_type:complete
MELEIKKTCPLGHTCRKIVGDHVEECHWYTKLVGMDPQTGKEVDEHSCAITWMPILATELSGQVRGANASILSLRNNVETKQKKALEVITNGLQNTKSS